MSAPESNVLRLTFYFPTSRDVVTLEAHEGFKIIGPLLLRCPESEVVARYVEPHWQVSGRNAVSFECVQPVFVRFIETDDGTPSFGPFNHVRFEESSCYADRILIAEMVTATERWRHCETGLRWRSMFIHEPHGRAGDSRAKSR
jgi:hypothetical protein